MARSRQRPVAPACLGNAFNFVCCFGIFFFAPTLQGLCLPLSLDLTLAFGVFFRALRGGGCEARSRLRPREPFKLSLRFGWSFGVIVVFFRCGERNEAQPSDSSMPGAGSDARKGMLEPKRVIKFECALVSVLHQMLHG